MSMPETKLYIVTGDTRQHKRILEEHGWRWNPERHRWEVPIDEVDDDELRKIRRLSGVRIGVVSENEEEEEEEDIDEDMFV